MGLLSIIRKVKERERELRVLVLYVVMAFMPQAHDMTLNQSRAHRIDTISLIDHSGLDNAGKTTCVKYLNHEDVHSISPTLGFSIQTIMHNECVPPPPPYTRIDQRTLDCNSKCLLLSWQIQAACVGRRRSENDPHLLAQLL
jgi:hypothetical protein